MVRSLPSPVSTRARLVRMLFASAIVWLSLAAGEAPVRAQSGITSPAPGSAVSGDVSVLGTAVIEPFQKYELHYKLEPSGDDAFIYFYGATNPVTNGQLGVWQAGSLPPGNYSLRLRVVKNDGNYAEFFAPNLSLNSGPAAPTPEPTSSEPTPTPIPTATFTPAPQPTPAVGQVDLPALPPTPTAQAVAEGQPAVQDLLPADNAGAAAGDAATDSASAGDLGPAADNAAAVASSGSLTRQLGEALSLSTLRGHFLNGMRISAALLLGVVALYGGKKLFDWVWTQFS